VLGVWERGLGGIGTNRRGRGKKGEEGAGGNRETSTCLGCLLLNMSSMTLRLGHYWRGWRIGSSSLKTTRTDSSVNSRGAIRGVEYCMIRWGGSGLQTWRRDVMSGLPQDRSGEAIPGERFFFGSDPSTARRPRPSDTHRPGGQGQGSGAEELGKLLQALRAAPNPGQRMGRPVARRGI